MSHEELGAQLISSLLKIARCVVPHHGRVHRRWLAVTGAAKPSTAS